MHELYSRYYLQHILWLKGSHHDYYVQPPAVRHHDIADVELKIIKDRERCLLWLDRCLAYEEDVNMLNLRTFLCDHSMHYLPVDRFDDHRVLSETADMLSDNRYAVVVRPKFMTSTTTVEQGAIFAHILGRKPGDVYAWGQGEFTQNAAAYAHPLTPGESAYLAHYNLAPVDPRALTDEQAQEAQRLFGDGPEARTQYANWRSRARIINHYKFTHPTTVEGLMLYYRVTRDTNPAWFALERGWQLGSGKEMFTGKQVSRTRAGLELLLGLGVIKLFGALAKAGRRAEAPEARPVKPAKGKGMPEVESPGKKAGDIDDGIQKKYIDSWEGAKTTTAQAQAEKLLSRASAAEPKVTKDLSDLAKATGGKQEGLDYRLKTKESLARKLETTNPENINDALRYTISYPSKDIGASANKVMRQLEDAGYTKVKVKNTFKPGSPYKGINTTFRTPDGQPFELQFHTPESFNTKQNLTHGMYEELRLLPGDSHKAEKLLEKIRAVSDENVPIPDGIQEIVPNF